MKTTLEGAGFNVVVATIDGQALGGKHISITPDLKFSDVKIADYKGLMVPCLDAAATASRSRFRSSKRLLLRNTGRRSKWWSYSP